jgi:hypothetical protein
VREDGNEIHAVSYTRSMLLRFTVPPRG